MTAPTGGRWVFSPVAGFNRVILSINNSLVPIFPAPRFGAYNIEVFTNPAVDTIVGSGFQASIFDSGGTLDQGFLTGTDILLGAGAYLLLDSITGSQSQSGSRVTLGSGNQTVIGAPGDTLVGGSGSQILSALAGNQTVTGGTGFESIWGGASNSIVGGTGPNHQIVVTGSNTTIRAPTAGDAIITTAAADTVLALQSSSSHLLIAPGVDNWIESRSESGAAVIIGSQGDTIVIGGGATLVEAAGGGMLIEIDGGLGTVSGSTSPVAGNTITGSFGSTGGLLNFNPGPIAGKGDLIDLSGSEVSATLNLFSFGTAPVASPDTVLIGSGTSVVFGGDGDRIGIGNGPTVGGGHHWSHADTVTGSAVGFGTNDTIASTTYDTVNHTATPGTVAGTSSALVLVTGFNTTTDFLFYQNETPATTGAIIATSQATAVGGTAGTRITLPDGTAMILIGVTQAQLTPALFKP